MAEDTGNNSNSYARRQLNRPKEKKRWDSADYMMGRGNEDAAAIQNIGKDLYLKTLSSTETTVPATTTTSAPPPPPQQQKTTAGIPRTPTRRDASAATNLKGMPLKRSIRSPALGPATTTAVAAAARTPPHRNRMPPPSSQPPPPPSSASSEISHLSLSGVSVSATDGGGNTPFNYSSRPSPLHVDLAASLSGGEGSNYSSGGEGGSDGGGVAEDKAKTKILKKKVSGPTSLRRWDSAEYYSSPPEARTNLTLSARKMYKTAMDLDQPDAKEEVTTRKKNRRPSLLGIAGSSTSAANDSSDPQAAAAAAATAAFLAGNKSAAAAAAEKNYEGEDDEDNNLTDCDDDE